MKPTKTCRILLMEEIRLSPFAIFLKSYEEWDSFDMNCIAGFTSFNSSLKFLRPLTSYDLKSCSHHRSCQRQVNLPPCLTYTRQKQGSISGLIKHWLPLIRVAIKTLISQLGGVRFWLGLGWPAIKLMILSQQKNDRGNQTLAEFLQNFTSVFEHSPDLWAFLGGPNLQVGFLLAFFFGKKVWPPGDSVRWKTGSNTPRKVIMNTCFFVLSIIWGKKDSLISALHMYIYIYIYMINIYIYVHMCIPRKSKSTKLCPIGKIWNPWSIDHPIQTSRNFFARTSSPIDVDFTFCLLWCSKPI